MIAVSDCRVRYTTTETIYDYRDHYWRVRYVDQTWEELTRREIEQLHI